MPKILVVDDEKNHEEVITQRFAYRDYLREYEFLFAKDGLKALQLIKNHSRHCQRKGKYNSSRKIKL